MEKLKQYYGFKTALLFFSIGTGLFLTYLITKSETLLILGFYYVIVAVITNSIIEIILFILLFINKNKQIETIVNMFFIACNIPIAYAYFLIVITNF